MANDAATKPAAVPLAWRKVGNVIGNAGTAEFAFILNQFHGKVGDIVALGMEVPADGYTSRSRIYVWARITDIQRFNPFFPYEAAQELAGEGFSLEDTVLSGTRDQLQATALILGATTDSDLANLFLLTYPVKPACEVFQPPAEAIRRLLIGGRENERKIKIGHLIARSDVEVNLSADKLVARHLAILAMTGGGKTVAARRIIRELIGQGYPLLILDPHGDYIGLWKCREMLAKEAPGCDIRLFYPELLMQDGGESLVEKLVGQMTDGMTEPQSDYLRSLFNSLPARTGEPTLDYIKRLFDRAEQEARATSRRGARRPAPGSDHVCSASVLAHRSRASLEHAAYKRTDAPDFQEPRLRTPTQPIQPARQDHPAGTGLDPLHGRLRPDHLVLDRSHHTRDIVRIQSGT